MRSRSADPRRTSGFTLIEVIVAIVILAVGLMGLAGATTYIVRQVLVSELRTERMLAVQSAIERIRAAGHGELLAGSDTTGDFTVEWTTPSLGSNVQTVQLISMGPGLTSNANGAPVLGDQVADTASYSVLRR